MKRIVANDSKLIHFTRLYSQDRIKIIRTCSVELLKCFVEICWNSRFIKFPSFKPTAKTTELLRYFSQKKNLKEMQVRKYFVKNNVALFKLISQALTYVITEGANCVLLQK